MESIVVWLSIIGIAFAGCPDKWLHNAHSCYYIGTDLVNWYTAKAKCSEKEGSHLAEIETKAESDYLEGIAMSLQADLWLGGTDADTEGQWIWEYSGTRLTYTDWFPGQPDNYDHVFSDEDCLHIADYFGDKWNDVHCTEIKQYVCELRYDTGPVVPIIG